MARVEHSVHPVERLGEAARALEGAVRRCAARPGRAAVHNLRTATRRVDAQMVLLRMLPGLPAYEAEAARAERLLKRLRHRAGVVRDLDVQQELVRGEAAVAGGASAGRGVRVEAGRLRRELKERREKATERLLGLLRRERRLLPAVFAKLLEALEPAEGIVLTETRLLGMVREWFVRQTAGGEVAEDEVSQRARSIAELHEMRKRAKLARYLAESAGEGAVAARRLARRFEGLQEAGGDWHDWLLLAEFAEKTLAAKAELTRRFRAHAERAQRGFERKLRYRM
jgi:CHAD domain-containing protein